ncbi:MAG: hypothetical protein D6691_01010 [Candidatus Hydrogenedentota bacterium]|nr:MAG: hypothetical protein D6691_01010 [Candidatus Hydrogenedentota bacterium]
MKRLLSVIAISAVSAGIYAGTPTIDGTFDGVSVWGPAVATNSNPGFSGAGATATDLYVTDDASYVYFGAQISGLAGWMSFGFAIDSQSGGGNTQETWGRQINFNFPTNSVGDAPDVVIRGNCNNSWIEQHTWNGSTWQGFGTNIGTSEANSNPSTGWIECRVAKSVLNMRASKQGQVEFYLTGDQNAHGLFTSVPYDTPCAEWNPSSPQVLSNPSGPVNLPVALSAFTLE